jgi:sugar lactone lactonase YvrE
MARGTFGLPTTATTALPNSPVLGASFSNSPYTGGGLDTPQAIAIDGSGDAWITNKVSGSGVNSGNGSVTELSSSGPPTSNSPYTGGGLSTPAGLAIDASGNAWVSDNGGVAVSKFNSGGTAQSGAGGYTGGGLGAPYGIAIDGSGDAWAVNSNSRSISKLSNSGTAVSGASGYSGGGLDAAFAVALDGSGNAWVTDYVGSITEFASSGTPASGSPYTGGGLNEPIGIAIDGSGNVWATKLWRQ